MLVVVERGDRQRQRQLALLLLGLEVEAAVPSSTLPESGDGTGGVEQVLGERGLAGVGVTGEDDVAQVGQGTVSCEEQPSG